MKEKMFISLVLLMMAISSQAQTVTVHADKPGDVIPKEIYGQFAEHLGTCIYGGLWAVLGL